MVHNAREKPIRLAEKLTRIRTELGLSQSQMIRRLGFSLRQSHISGYELGTREPSLLVLLCYARIAGVAMEVLVDDELDLPEHLPATIASDRIVKPKKRR